MSQKIGSDRSVLGLLKQTPFISYLEPIVRKGSGIRVPAHRGAGCRPSPWAEAPPGGALGPERHPAAILRKHHRARRRGEVTGGTSEERKMGACLAGA